MLITLLSFVFVLGILIFIHELGHFAVAKWVGIRVEKFSLGFPPNIFAKKRGDTTYCIGIIPLGGFVKMAGENPDDQASGAPDEFQSKTVSQRAAVIFAGPFMNYIAAIFFMILYVAVIGFPKIDERGVAVGAVVEESPAAVGGLIEGDVILTIDGQETKDFETLRGLISPNPGNEIDVTWLRGDETLSATMVPSAEIRDKDTIGMIGFSQAREPVPLGQAFQEGFLYTHYVVAATGKWLAEFFTGESSASQIGGPIFIAKESGKAARNGLGPLLHLLGLLSINLAILNVLPIPVLDGAHLVFLALEKIKGDPISLKARLVAQQIGLVMILSLMVLVTYNDIVRVFFGN